MDHTTFDSFTKETTSHNKKFCKTFMKLSIFLIISNNYYIKVI